MKSVLHWERFIRQRKQTDRCIDRHTKKKETEKDEDFLTKERPTQKAKTYRKSDNIRDGNWDWKEREKVEQTEIRTEKMLENFLIDYIESCLRRNRR